MKKLFLSLSIISSAFAGLACAVASVAAAPFVWLFDAYLEASPLSAISRAGVNLWRLVSGRVQYSQAGRGVAAFITNLFKVAGRSYAWRSPRVA